MSSKRPAEAGSLHNGHFWGEKPGPGMFVYSIPEGN
jgi:hypothetical protein